MMDAAMMLVAAILILEAVLLRHRLQGLRALPRSGVKGFQRRDEPGAGPLGAPSQTVLLRPQTPKGFQRRDEPGAGPLGAPSQTALLRPQTPNGFPGRTWEFVCAAGVVVDDGTRQAAIQHAASERFDVLDLIPGDLPIWRVMDLAGRVDFRTHRDALAAAETAGYALCVKRSVLEAANHSHGCDHLTPASLADLVWRLRRHASTTTDFVVAPNLRAPAWTMGLEAGLKRAVLGPLAPIAMGIEAWIVCGLLAGALSGSSWGWLALALFHLEPLAVATGGPVRFRNLLLYVLLRTPIQLGLWTRRLIGYASTSSEDQAVTDQRPLYRSLLAEGTQRFFEPRRATCPLCDAPALSREVVMPNHLDNKPGRFSLDRCEACGHVFQNPRLNAEGLSFYYRDFYEGLGEKSADQMFRTFFERSYAGCAALLRDGLAASGGGKHALDVGCGHAHFAWTARRLAPHLVVDGLDLSESVELAARRGWVRKGYRGLFTELAPQMAASERYDAVTMRHYLEHCLDPRAELDAARLVLEPGGLLLIEVPNPDCGWRHLFRGYWGEWFQPQHLHLVSAGNLATLLRERGFEPLRWHFGEAHLPSHFSVGAVFLLGGWFPHSDRPWLAPLGAAGRMLRGLVWGGLAPVFAVTALLDALTVLGARSLRWSNVYRVMARKA